MFWVNEVPLDLGNLYTPDKKIVTPMSRCSESNGGFFRQWYNHQDSAQRFEKYKLFDIKTDLFKYYKQAFFVLIAEPVFRAGVSFFLGHCVVM